MLVTLFGIIKSPFTDGYAIRVVLLLLNKIPFSAEYAQLSELIFIEERLVHPEKVEEVMYVVPFPIVTLTRLSHPLKAYWSMMVTLSGTALQPSYASS
jgi:hypothetical protein